MLLVAFYRFSLTFYRLPFQRIAAVGGLIWLAGRVVFARGYMTGDPKKRRSGEFDLIGLFVMLFANFSFIRWLLFGTTE